MFNPSGSCLLILGCLLLSGTAAGAAPAAKPQVVTIEAFQFSPDNLTIKKGERVTFINKDATPHTVTPSPKAKFEGSGRLLAGESKTIQFDARGTQAYFCEFHTTMTGRVTVR